MQEVRKKPGMTCRRKLKMPEKNVIKPKSRSQVEKVTETTTKSTTAVCSPVQSDSHGVNKARQEKTTGSSQSRPAVKVFRRPRPVSERLPSPRKPVWMIKHSGIVDLHFYK